MAQTAREAQEDLDRLLDTSGEYARYWEPKVRDLRILIGTGFVLLGMVGALSVVLVLVRLDKLIDLLGMLVIK